MSKRLRNPVLWMLLIVSVFFLPGSDIECDLEDGEFELDLPSLDFDRDYDDGYWDVWYYEDVYYEPCGYWCW